MEFTPINIKKYKDRYTVSKTGEVYSIKFKRILKKRIKNGYYTVELCYGRSTYEAAIHRLVAGAYIENPHNYPKVNHKNGNPFDNNVENLEWITQKRNVNHALETGLTTPNTRPVIKMDLNGNELQTYKSVQDAAADIGLTRHAVIRVCKGKNNTAGGFKWKYVTEEIKVNLNEFILIPDMEYMASTDGRIYSVLSKIVLKPMKNENGYYYVTICKKGKKKRNYYVHQLIAMTYIPNPDKKKYVNHKNLNKTDNRIENLEWTTQSENVKHYYKNKRLTSKV
jgi:hypothetical protein